MDKLKSTINKQKGVLTAQQHTLNKKYNLDCATKYKITDKGDIYAYDKYKVLMEAKYQIIGTLNEKTCYWRWGWSNPFLSCNLIKSSKKMIEYGEKKQLPKFYTSKVKGKSNAFPFLVIASLLEPKSCGYLIYKEPNTTITIYILLFSCKKSKKSLEFINKLQ